MLYLGYRMKVGVELPGEGFNPTTRQVVRHDRGLKRWVRGIFKTRDLLNVLHLVTAALGAYAAIV
jgi:hypothetical protein